MGSLSTAIRFDGADLLVLCVSESCYDHPLGSFSKYSTTRLLHRLLQCKLLSMFDTMFLLLLSLTHCVLWIRMAYHDFDSTTADKELYLATRSQYMGCDVTFYFRSFWFLCMACMVTMFEAHLLVHGSSDGSGQFCSKLSTHPIRSADFQWWHLCDSVRWSSIKAFGWRWPKLASNLRQFFWKKTDGKSDCFAFNSLIYIIYPSFSLKNRHGNCMCFNL